MKLYKGIAILFLLSACVPKGGTITLKTLLNEMTDGGQPSFAWTARMTSSHDRSSVSSDSPDWFANNDGFGFERTEIIQGRREKVLMEDNHPGVITRFWLTTRNPRGTMRFYFDGHVEPDWVVPGFDLTEFGLNELDDNPLLQKHTSYEKGIKGGQTLFLPIPYAKSCKITFEEPEGWSGIPRYYQIEYRRYRDDANIESFGLKAVKKYSSDIKNAGKKLRAKPMTSGKPYMAKAEIASGEALRLVLPSGSHVVKELTITANLEGLDADVAMRGLILEAFFDGQKTVCVPLSDFQGSGLNTRAVDCRQLLADGNGLVQSFWSMPYSAEAAIEIVNSCDHALPVSVEARVKASKFEGYYFHSDWHAGVGIKLSKDSNGAGEWEFARLRGRGWYAGDNLTVFNHSKAWYGEGDEKIYVDGETFPSFFGTGTEDYYNSSWAPVVVFHTPWGGAPIADLASSRGYNTFLRTRIADIIPFRESLDFNFELLSWNPGTADYFRTTYWYGSPGSECLNADDPVIFEYELPEAPPDPTSFAMKNAVEIENILPAELTGGLQYDRQDMRGFPEGVWSCGRQMTLFAGKNGDSATFELSPAEEGVYSLFLFATKANDYGIMEISLNGGKPVLVDCYFTDVVNSGEIALGEAETKDGKIIMTVRIVGKNKNSRGTLLGLDYLLMQKI